jgi:hypothetical protein
MLTFSHDKCANYCQNQGGDVTAEKELITISAY